MRRLAVALAAVALAGCGEADAPRTDADVVRAWADAVREGDYATANALFALPAVVANGSPRMRLEKRGDVNEFNRGLTCGAILLSTQPANGGYVRADFELVDGKTPCEGRAEVSFRIEDGRITEWLREATGPPPGSTEV